MTASEYNQCVDSYADGVFRFIRKNIVDEDRARDVVQDSFEKMWIKHADISFEKARSYLFTTAYHTMIDDIRKNSRQTELTEAAFNIHSHTNEYNGLKEILDEAVANLPEIQKNVILLRDYEGYSYQEIGEITNLSESQVKVYIYRARNFLKTYIGSLDKVI